MLIRYRDTATGNIIRTDISVQDFKGANLMIVDDICDGGRTFIELAKVLRERNAGKIELFITHGIFSKGVDVFDGYVDQAETLRGRLIEIDEMLQEEAEEEDNED